MSKPILYLAMLLPLFISSCQKDLDPDFAQAAYKLTLHGVLGEAGARTSHPDYLGINVSKSAQSYSNEYPFPIGDAKLSLYENGLYIYDFMAPRPDTIRDTIITTRGNYSIQKTFAGGNTYEVRASHPELEDVTARFYMPYPTEILSAEWDTATHKISFSFKDLPGEDFYSFTVTVHDSARNVSYGSLRFEATDPNIRMFQNSSLDSNFIPINGDLQNRGHNAYLNDHSFDGEIKTLNFQLIDWPGSNILDSFTSEAKAEIQLYHLTPDFYEYQKSYDAYLRTENNPFAEKVQLHSNVENGYGILGAKVPSSKIAIKK